jgi:hypothetical protein
MGNNMTEVDRLIEHRRIMKVKLKYLVDDALRYRMEIQKVTDRIDYLKAEERRHSHDDQVRDTRG